jgi:hypothetical protein
MKTANQFRVGDWVSYWNNKLGGEEMGVIQKILDRHLIIHTEPFSPPKRVLKSNCW